MLAADCRRQKQFTEALKLIKRLQTQMTEFERQQGPAKGPTQLDAPEETVVVHISIVHVENSSQFATCTLHSVALTWWEHPCQDSLVMMPAYGHFKRECPKLKNNNNRGNQVGGGNAPTKVYTVGHTGTNPDSNIVTGTFLLNNRYASILFDTGADRSFGGDMEVYGSRIGVVVVIWGVVVVTADWRDVASFEAKERMGLFAKMAAAGSYELIRARIDLLSLDFMGIDPRMIKTCFQGVARHVGGLEDDEERLCDEFHKLETSFGVLFAMFPEEDHDKLFALWNGLRMGQNCMVKDVWAVLGVNFILVTKEAKIAYGSDMGHVYMLLDDVLSLYYECGGLETRMEVLDTLVDAMCKNGRNNNIHSTRARLGFS
ncbi:hypothetical protein Tco_0525712 [Tanacetum coccineum]